MSTRIIGIGSGQGDDQLGWAAVRALESQALPPGCTLHLCDNPASELLPLLGGCAHAILVDAMVDGGPAGRVLRCAPGAVQPRAGGSGSHGLSVDTVLALAAALGVLPQRVSLLGVTLDPDHCALAPDLSPAVRAALPALVAQVLAAATEQVPADAALEECS
jgi:hydrogenase maturation protease